MLANLKDPKTLNLFSSESTQPQRQMNTERERERVCVCVVWEVSNVMLFWRYHGESVGIVVI
jgi:hypothetical protein